MPIRTVDDALDWGDSWQQAYLELARDAEKTIFNLQLQLIHARADLNIEQGERILERLGII